MKKIECFIKPERVEELRNTLVKEGVAGMTFTDVRGFGRENSRPGSYLVLPKMKVEIFCSDEQLDSLVEAIIKVCRRNELGDGKIAISTVDEIIRIRTGETSLQAVY